MKIKLDRPLPHASKGVVQKLWEPEETSLLIRMHAEGYYNTDIMRALPGRSRSAVDAKMESLGLERNIMPKREKQHRAMQKLFGDILSERESSIPCWIWFEDITKDEARVIAREAPRSLKVPTPRVYIGPLIGCSAEMCAR